MNADACLARSTHAAFNGRNCARHFRRVCIAIHAACVADSNTTMDGTHFAKLCKDANLGASTTDVDLAFKKVRLDLL